MNANQPKPAESGKELERAQLARIRRAVHDQIAASFRRSLNEHDVEDATSAAMLALIVEQRRQHIRDPLAFAKTAGFRAAIKINRLHRAVPVDPLDSPVLDGEDLSHSPLERLDGRTQLARIAEALEQLDDDKLAAFHLRFIERMPHGEACERLGIGRSAYFDRVKAAKAAVEGAVELSSHPYIRRQRQLLSDYTAGLLSGRARRRAERLISSDPQALVMARELCHAHEHAAMLLPVLSLGVVIPSAGDEAASGVIARLSEAIAGLTGRDHSVAELASSPALAAGGRGAGLVGAGLLAKVSGSLGVGGAAIACLGAGAVATVACVATGVLPLSADEHRPADRHTPALRVAPERTADQASAQLRLNPEPVTQAPRASQTTTSPVQADDTSGRQEPQPPVAEASAPLEITAREQEFGIEATGAPADRTPSSAGHSAGSEVRPEFGL